MKEPITVTVDKKPAKKFEVDDFSKLEELYDELIYAQEIVKDFESNPNVREYKLAKDKVSKASERLRALVASRVRAGGVELQGQRGSVKVSSATLTVTVVEPDLLDEGLIDDIQDAERRSNTKYLVTSLHPSRVQGLRQQHPALADELESAGVIRSEWSNLRTTVTLRGGQ